ncbi:hypothetical protein [Methanogenium cariaci]|uniref:hypothetical protein n=1 Tax=Methanogenium cariaci TaxID=2197 RepID=UPI001FDFC970|nr:hypothetical protein [Methanogenium cariaci]
MPTRGFEEIVKLSDETVTPERTIPPAALLVAIGITIILYIAVSISVVSIGGYEAIAGSPPTPPLPRLQVRRCPAGICCLP